MQTFKIVYLSLMDIGCFSHTIDHVGGHFKTPTLSDFIGSWITLFFFNSAKNRLLWKNQTGQSMSIYSFSSTWWWSKWEVNCCIKPFLEGNEDIGPATWPKLLEVMNDSQKLAFLRIELASTIDWERTIC